VLQIERSAHRIIAALIDAPARLLYRAGIACGWWCAAGVLPVEPRRILVIEAEPLGDAVMATPAFAALRKKFPQAHIAVLTGPWAADIFRNNPSVDEVIVTALPWAFSPPLLSWAGLSGHARFLAGASRVARMVKQKNFDVAIDLRGDFRNIFFFMVAPDIPARLSFSRAGGDYFLSAALPFVREKHEVEKAGDLLAALGADFSEKKIQLFCSSDDEKAAADALAAAGILAGRKITVIHPGAGRQVRIWPAERYAAVADTLSGQLGMAVIITGTAAERHLATGIIEKCLKKQSVYDFTGMLRIMPLAALLKRAALLVCPDTGIMHLAAAFDVPTVALIGPGDPGQVGPYQQNARLIDKKFPCRPCLQKKCIIEHVSAGACMEAITVQDVVDAAIEIINRAPVPVS
jgi:lipopolysaccharide heptosyltransferase II